MIFQNLLFLLLLLSSSGVYQVQAAFTQEIYNIPEKYQRCNSSPCRMWNGSPLPSCPSGILSYTNNCKESPSACPGIWPELTYKSDRIPTCKNLKTGCWELLTQSSQWECVDPRINACPNSEVGVSLKMVGDNWVCEDAFCPGKLVLKEPYQNAFWKCVKHETDSICPGDGEYIKGNLFYNCQSQSCQLMKKGESYYCPADPETCEDTSKTFIKGINEYNSRWHCANPRKEFDINDFMPFIVAAVVGILALLMFVIQKHRAQKLEKTLYSSHNNSFSQPI